MDPNFYMSHADLGFVYMQKNMCRQALQEFQKSFD
jgi:hypothetical protein